MKTKMKVKMFIDILMTVFVLMLMAYQVTGEKLHEWLGTGMVVLFLAHNLLDIRWYGRLMKGKYSLLRIFRTSDQWWDGSGESAAPCRLLLGICTDERSSWASLAYDNRNDL